MKAEQEKYFVPCDTTIETPHDKTSFLVNKYGTKRTHPDDKAITAREYVRFSKKTNVTAINKRFLKIGLLNLHPWAIYTKGSHESGPGLVKCGLCYLAKEKGCELWRDGKKPSKICG